MKIRKTIFKAAAEIEYEINDKIDLLLKSKSLGFETFRASTMEAVRSLDEACKGNGGLKESNSAVYTKLIDMYEGFEDLDRGYNKFKDYFEFFKNFQIDLKYNEEEMLSCFKVNMKDAGGVLKPNMEEQSEIFAETFSNMSVKDDLMSKLDSSIILDERTFAKKNTEPFTVFNNTPINSQVKTTKNDQIRTMQNFFSSPRVLNSNFLRSSTHLSFVNTQPQNTKTHMKMSSIEMSDMYNSPKLQMKKGSSIHKTRESAKDCIGTREFNDPAFMNVSRKPSITSTLPQTPQMPTKRRSPSPNIDPDIDNTPATKKSQVFPNLRASTHFQALPEQIANLSNLTIDATKLRKVVLTITSCYKTITRINFRSNVFNCEPLELLSEIFSKPLPSLFTIDLRKNQINSSSEISKDEINRLLMSNVKVII